MRMARTSHIEYQSNYPSRVHSLYCFVSNTIIDYFLLKSMHFCIFDIFYKFKHINLYCITMIHFKIAAQTTKILQYIAASGNSMESDHIN